MSIFQKEIARRLNEEEYNFSFENGEFSVTLSGGYVIKIRENDVLYIPKPAKRRFTRFIT